MSKYTCIVIVVFLLCFTIIGVSADITKATINCNKNNLIRSRTYPNYITLEKVNRSCYYLKSTDYDNPILYSWNDINVRSRRPKSK